MALTQDVIDNPEQMYPDLLNIPNRVIGKLFPINVSSYATLPRNRHQRSGSLGNGNNVNTCAASNKNHQSATTSDSKNTRLQNVMNYQNLDTTTTHINESDSMPLCTSCLKKQDPNKTIVYPNKYDNMGRRITASGNSILSIPDEEKEISYCATNADPNNHHHHHHTTSNIETVNIASDMSSVTANCINVGDCSHNNANTSRAANISSSVALNSIGCSTTSKSANLNSKNNGNSTITTISNAKSNSKLCDRDSTRIADNKMLDVQGK